jgi:hypothetical protein
LAANRYTALAKFLQCRKELLLLNLLPTTVFQLFR